MSVSLLFLFCFFRVQRNIHLAQQSERRPILQTRSLLFISSIVSTSCSSHIIPPPLLQSHHSIALFKPTMKKSNPKPPPPPGLPTVSQRISAIKLAARSHSSTKTFPGGEMLVLPEDKIYSGAPLGMVPIEASKASVNPSLETKVGKKKKSWFMPFQKNQKKKKTKCPNKKSFLECAASSNDNPLV